MNKQKIIQEMKTYNEELNKHFSNINIDDIIEIKSKFSKSSNDNDFLDLVANNMIDLKTEINLMRKNLSVDLENMTRQFIKKEQEIFLNETNQLYNKLFIEIKENFSEHINFLSTSVLDMKKEFNNFKEIIENNNIEKINPQLHLLNKRFDIIEKRISNIQSNNNNIMELNKNFTNHKANLNKNYPFQNNFIEENSFENEQKIIALDNEIQSITSKDIQNEIQDQRSEKILNLNERLRTLEAQR